MLYKEVTVNMLITPPSIGETLDEIGNWEILRRFIFFMYPRLNDDSVIIDAAIPCKIYKRNGEVSCYVSYKLSFDKTKI